MRKGKYNEERGCKSMPDTRDLEWSNDQAGIHYLGRISWNNWRLSKKYQALQKHLETNMEIMYPRHGLNNSEDIWCIIPGQ